MIRYIFLILFFSISTIYSQHILLSETTPIDFSEIDNGFGPNRNYFIYNFISYGTKSRIINPENESFLPLKSSLEIKFGTRYRKRINRYLGVIYDLEFISSWNKLNLKKDPELPLGSLDVKKAKYIYHQISNSLAFQINFKPKRGNQLGKYLDLGIYGGYNYSKRFMYKLDIVDVSKSARVTMKRLNYFNPFEYGFSLRLGHTKGAYFGKFRLSNLFNENTSFMSAELPRLTFGLEIFIPSEEL